MCQKSNMHCVARVCFVLLMMLQNFSTVGVSANQPYATVQRKKPRHHHTAIVAQVMKERRAAKTENRKTETAKTEPLMVEAPHREAGTEHPARMLEVHGAICGRASSQNHRSVFRCKVTDDSDRLPRITRFSWCQACCMPARQCAHWCGTRSVPRSSVDSSVRRIAASISKTVRPKTVLVVLKRHRFSALDIALPVFHQRHASPPANTSVPGVPGLGISGTLYRSAWPRSLRLLGLSVFRSFTAKLRNAWRGVIRTRRVRAAACRAADHAGCDKPRGLSPCGEPGTSSSGAWRAESQRCRKAASKEYSEVVVG